MDLKHFVSSAKLSILEWEMELGKSFRFKINSNGPNILLWGTPGTTAIISDL